jgi:hypothetical protein
MRLMVCITLPQSLQHGEGPCSSVALVDTDGFQNAVPRDREIARLSNRAERQSRRAADR